ncbi:hypothetical protein GWL_11460 [Herbaspirillum sp. GW103]|nr:hypothetical protein GWL_11460 [Herbaspirillum sp. GW103]
MPAHRPFRLPAFLLFASHQAKHDQAAIAIPRDFPELR